MHYTTYDSKKTSFRALYTLYSMQSIDEIARDDLSKRLTLFGNSWLPSSINADRKTWKSSWKNDFEGLRNFTLPLRQRTKLCSRR